MSPNRQNRFCRNAGATDSPAAASEKKVTGPGTLKITNCYAGVVTA
jgi:hypothetical protein